MPNGFKKVTISFLILLSFIGAFVGIQSTTKADNARQNVSLKVEPQTKDLKFQNGGSNFFDFNLGSNDNLNQDLTIKVTNNDKSKPVTFKTSYHQATTSPDAKVVYDGKGKLVKQMFDFKSFMSASADEHKVTLNPGESRDLHFHVQTPNNDKFKNFSGTILGGIYLLEQPSAKADKKAKRVAYPIAIMINKGTASPNIAMKRVKADTWYNHNIVDAMITNNHPTILGNMDYKATVVKKGTDDVVAKASRDNGQIGPNNQFKFEIPWLTKRITPGVYTMKVKIKSTDPQLGSKGSTWFLEKDFTVSVLDAVILNAKVTHSIPWIFLGVTILILALCYGLVRWLLKIREHREGLDK